MYRALVIKLKADFVFTVNVVSFSGRFVNPRLHFMSFSLSAVVDSFLPFFLSLFLCLRK